jgi:glucose-6-phosphate isomerase
VNINAYHQPGVEQGKKGANLYIDIHRKTLQCLRKKRGASLTPGEVAREIGVPEEVEFIYKILEHTYINRIYGVKKMPGENLFTAGYYI